MRRARWAYALHCIPPEYYTYTFALLHNSVYFYAMRRSLLVLGFLAVIATICFSCRYDRVYYHTRHGHYRSVRARRSMPWFNSGEKGYSKPARRTIHRWDRNFR